MQATMPNGLRIVERKNWASGITDGGSLSLSRSYNRDKHIILPESFGDGAYYGGMNLFFSADNAITTYKSGAGASILTNLGVAIAKVNKAIRKRASVTLTVDNTVRIYDFDLSTQAPNTNLTRLFAQVHNVSRFAWITTSAAQYVVTRWAEPYESGGNLYVRFYYVGSGGGTVTVTLSAEVALL